MIDKWELEKIRDRVLKQTKDGLIPYMLEFMGVIEQNIDTQYFVNDPWTICVLDLGIERYAGASKRCTYERFKDQPNEQRGKEIALSRAFDRLFENRFMIPMLDI